ncbi:MAG: DUF86 domain-containing protein [Actinobacteria bacterium]|nr:DUF86 domain-containing protein [Actinomycetota bacterium]
MLRDRLSIEEMIMSAKRAIELVGDDGDDAVASDRSRLDALLWNFTVVGEGASQVSTELITAWPEVPWRRPAQLRNRIVHGYWSIDVGILCDTVRDQLPAFVDQLQAILANLDLDG